MRAILERPGIRQTARRLSLLALGTAIVLGVGVLVDRTELFEADEAIFDLIYGIDFRPRLIDAVVVDQHLVNYTLITILTGVAAWRSGISGPVAAMARVAAAGLVSYAAVVVSWAVWERPRPQEALGVAPEEHDWSSFPSYPSGHVVVTTALAIAASTLVPALRVPLWAFAALTAVTRVLYGAHLPSDVLFGVVLGYLGAAVVVTPRSWVATRERLSGASRSPARHALRRLAGAAAVLAVGVFLVLLATAGPPASPEGGAIPGDVEREVQVVLLALAAVTALAAWEWHGLGAPLVLLGAVLGVFATLEYTPGFAVFAALGFVVPGTLFLLAWPRVLGGAQIAGVAMFVAVTMAAGAWGAVSLHEREFGAAHPQSQTKAPPTWRVEWAWSGAVTPTSVSVNTRVNADGRVRLLVARGRDLQSAKPSPAQTADDDTNGRLLSFDVGGLRPDTEYHYAIEFDGRVDQNRTGTFRTFPARSASFKFAFGACARVGSNGAVFDAIRRERPLFFLATGDFFYANIDENSRSRFLDTYDRALEQPAQDALYRSTPIAYVWDDHDFGGNNADASSESRPAARFAYDAAVPHYPLSRGTRGPIFQAFTAGRVRFLLLDTRSERSPDDQRDGVRKSMLGPEQKAWLKRELLGARDRYALTVVSTSVPWVARAQAGADNWAGFATERAELSRFIARHRIKNLMMLGGDAHMLAIDDGSHTDYSGTGKAGFPMMHAAALDRQGSVKGGPYSEGAFPGAGQYGIVTIDDRGGERVRVALSGRTYAGRERVGYRFEVPVSDGAAP